MKLPAWTRGPYELIEHAESHYIGASDVDRRIALISFDNAIEVIITTYLQLNPKLRGGETFRKDDVQKWLQNYHSKIEFFEYFTEAHDIPLESSTAEIIWYHTLRNELYHSGNGMVPELHNLDGVREAAIEVFQALFRINVTPLLETSVTTVAKPEADDGKQSTVQNRFLQSYIAFERALRASALAIGMEADSRAQGSVRIWDEFKEQAGEKIKSYDTVIKNARNIRNQFAHTGITKQSDEELESLIIQLDEVVAYLQSYAFSFGLLSSLKERYKDWVKPNLLNVRIIHKDGKAFLEVANKAHGLYDENIKRVDLNFIRADEDELLFSPSLRAQENADLFFDELDLYSMVMTGIADFLFTEEGLQEAAKLSGADKGMPNGNLIRRSENT